uniref:Secreted protein n=1 Tax=Globodera pallida TaxID=36090 RepID=A0A183C207_GLOPA
MMGKTVTTTTTTTCAIAAGNAVVVAAGVPSPLRPLSAWRGSLFDRLTVHLISGFDKMANPKQGAAESESGEQCQEH